MTEFDNIEQKSVRWISFDEVLPDPDFVTLCKEGCVGVGWGCA